MPALSPTMSVGNLAKWRVKEGQEVKPGTLIAEGALPTRGSAAVG